MSDAERRRFGNLLLLCSTHHRIVDSIRPDDFSIEELLEWKKKREGRNYEVLKRLPGIFDEELLEAILTDAIKEQAKELEKQVSRFEAAISKLAAVDSEAASLLAQRMKAANTLHRAASMLLHTEDTSQVLYAAGRSLEGIDETAETLLMASGAFRNLDDIAEQLSEIADQFRRIIRLVDTLSTVGDYLEDAYVAFSNIDKILSHKIKELHDLLDDM